MVNSNLIDEFRVLESLNIGVILVDSDLKFVYANQKYYSISNLNKQTLTGESLVSLYPDAELNGLLFKINQSIKYNFAVTFNSAEIDFFNINTETIIYNITINPYSSTNKTFSLISFLPRKRISDSTIIQDNFGFQWRKKVLSFSTCGKAQIYLKTKFVFFNHEASQIFNAPNEELSNDLKSWLESVHPNDVKYIKNIYRNLLKNKKDCKNICEEAVRMRCPDDNWIWLIINVQNVNIVNDVIDEITVNIQDVTNRIQLYEKHLQREKEFQALVEKNPSPIIKIDRLFRIIYVNPPSKSILEFREKRYLGRKIFDI